MHLAYRCHCQSVVWSSTVCGVRTGAHVQVLTDRSRLTDRSSTMHAELEALVGRTSCTAQLLELRRCLALHRLLAVLLLLP